MKAIVQDTYGSPDVLELRDIDRPVAGDNELLVQVHAAAVDPGVWHLMTGLPYLVRAFGYGLRAPKVPVRGRDVAGRVEAVGKNVTRFVANSSRRYDLILDTAGNRPLAHLRRALTAKGSLVIVGGEGGGRWLGGFDRSLRALMLSPFVGQKLRGLISKENSADLRVLGEYVGAGKLTPIIDRTYPLSEVPEAIRYVEEGHPRGKVAVTV